MMENIILKVMDHKKTKDIIMFIILINIITMEQLTGNHIQVQDIILQMIKQDWKLLKNQSMN